MPKQKPLDFNSSENVPFMKGETKTTVCFDEATHNDKGDDNMTNKIQTIKDLREEKEGEEIICIREINDNFRRIKNNQPLTRPLAVLNRSCEFKKRYDLMFEDEVNEEKKAHQKAYHKEYHQRPEVKAHHKAHQKAYHKEYYQRKKKELKLKENDK